MLPKLGLSVWLFKLFADIGKLLVIKFLSSYLKLSLAVEVAYNYNWDTCVEGIEVLWWEAICWISILWIDFYLLLKLSVIFETYFKDKCLLVNNKLSFGVLGKRYSFKANCCCAFLVSMYLFILTADFGILNKRFVFFY